MFELLLSVGTKGGQVDGGKREKSGKGGEKGFKA